MCSANRDFDIWTRTFKLSEVKFTAFLAKCSDANAQKDIASDVRHVNRRANLPSLSSLAAMLWMISAGRSTKFNIVPYDFGRLTLALG